MANLIRSAKSCSDWTLNDLDAYHIELHSQNHLTFFGVQALPLPQVDPELINTSAARDMVQDCNAELIHLLDLAMNHRAGEPAVNDFMVELFKRLGYVRRNRIARTRRENLALLICGEHRDAEIDVCLLDRSRNEILLLVQEDKWVEDSDEGANAEAQLVAKAIAAFTENNKNREAIGLDPLTEKVMPGIMMVGTAPTFFKIPVTEQLVYHVRHGTYPPQSMLVIYCCPPLARSHSEGMRPLDNRQPILSCFEAFKPIVGI
ncbi:hypothetical protein K435DRAFT_665350 [Dendrothele bispora CBS 962.96]|uniref:Uncharacterized protein n=1 Tax=Dendrothele bispora (strain CBS 962.96) TaxID=1314807 RepID=A0A4S8M2P2_DENBC|nr:hypothetical protein K435DRAFT_665350 [Dendrothele bispora CBS 962.96]